MRYPGFFLLVVALIATPVSAQLSLATGDVLVYSKAPVFPDGPSFAVLTPAGNLKSSSNLWATGVLAPSPDLVLMSQQWHITVNDAKSLGSRGLDHLGEIVETRAGHYLVAEASADDRPAVVLFGRAGEVIDVVRLPLSARAANIELLSDQCTLVHTTGWDADADESRRVRRFNLCTGREEPDLFSVPEDATMAGAVRELPGGELLVATGMDVRRFDANGNQLDVYPVAATHLALTPEGNGFWAAWNRTLQRIDFVAPRNIAVSLTLAENHTGAIGVVGEWRSAVRTPAPPRRRRVR